MTAALQDWHPGEVVLQRKLGYADAISSRWACIENAMREQHRIFHTSNLPFIPVTTLDDDGRPWGSIIAGATGKIGFVKSPDVNTLTVDCRLWDGEPLLSTVRTWLNRETRPMTAPERFLMAGIGIEFPTRRRNKFAGLIRGVKRRTGLDYELDLQVTQALGNCPKYINVRELIPYPNSHPSVTYQTIHMGAGQRLPDEVIRLITDADTIFIASVYKSKAPTTEKHPSHAGMNARSGLPGFVRVCPSDGRTVVFPDYSGNRFLSSLGNIESSGLAGLTIVSFTTGDVLYLTGTAQVLIGPPALDLMARQACITTIKTTGYTFVRDALPIRQEPGTDVDRSPYSPRIKYLREEPEARATTSGGLKAQLTSAMQFGPDIAIFRFNVISSSAAEGLKIRPGQAIILDFMDWIGPPVYQHMAHDAPGSINDDRIRTWTVSSAHRNQYATWFELTMREMQGGAVTGALFNLLREHLPNKWEHPVQLDMPKVVADIVGVTGSFYMGQEDVRMLWVAGGIGITPFMAMFTALTEHECSGPGDIVLALSTREPNVFLKLIKTSFHRILPKVKVRIDLFTHQDDIRTEELEKVNMRILIHKGRIQPDYWIDVAEDRDVLICGPGEFGNAAVDGLRAAGVSNSRIHREGFY